MKGYDYSQAGLYFITICTQDGLHLFGEITDEEMVLNDSGRMIEKWWNELKNNHWTPFNKKLRQRNYYEHIIRNEKSYLHISEYIKTNPLKWLDDKYYG